MRELKLSRQCRGGCFDGLSPRPYSGAEGSPRDSLLLRPVLKEVVDLTAGEPASPDQGGGEDVDLVPMVGEDPGGAGAGGGRGPGDGPGGPSAPSGV